MAGISDKAKVDVILNGQQAADQLNDLTKRANHYKDAMAKAMAAEDPAAYAKAEKGLKGVQKEMRQLRKEAFNVNKVLNDLSGSSMPDLIKAEKKLEAEMAKVKRRSKDWDEYKKKLIDVRKEKRKLRREMNGLDEPQSKFSKGIGSMKSAASGLLPAFGIAAILSGLVAVGKKIFGLAQETMAQRQKLQQMTGETGQSLSDLTADTSGLAKSFKKDFDEVATAQHNFAKSMQISEQAANSLISKGFIAGADASGEFLDQLREYGPQFKQAGFSAEQTIAIMTQQVKDGVFSDKGVDAIKEASLSLREMPKSAADALAGIGLSGEEIQRKLADGSMSMQEAIALVSEKIGQLPANSQAVGTAIADIFKGAGEDAGLEFITGLSQIDKSMEDLIKDSGEAADAQQRLVDANKQLERVWGRVLGNGTTFFTSLKASSKAFLAEGIVKIYNGFIDISNWFIEFYNESVVFRAIIKTIGTVSRMTFDGIVNSLKNAWVGAKALGKMLKAALTFDKKGLVDALNEGWQEIKQNHVDNAEKTGKAWKKAYEETVNATPLKPLKQKIDLSTSQSTSTTMSGDATQAMAGMASRVGGSVNDLTSTLQSKLATKFVIETELKKPDNEKLKTAIQEQLDAMNAAREELGLADKETEDYNTWFKLLPNEEARAWEMEQLASYYEQGIISEEEFQRKKDEIQAKYSQKRMQQVANYFNAADALVSGAADFFEAQKQRELAAAGDNVKKQEQIEKKYAKINQKVAISQAMIKGALAIMNIWAGNITGNPIVDAVIKGVMTATQVGTTSAQVATIRAQRFEHGRYPVMGADDNELYNAQFVGSPSTGVHSGTKLGIFSEKMPEAVIDGPTTQKLLFNYPHIWKGITDMSQGAVPQFAGGRYPVSAESSSFESPLLLELLTKLDNTLSKGIRANLLADDEYYEKHEEAAERVQNFRQRVTTED